MDLIGKSIFLRRNRFAAELVALGKTLAWMNLDRLSQSLELMDLAAVSRYHHLVDLHSLAHPDGIVVSEASPFHVPGKESLLLDLQGGERLLDDGCIEQSLGDDGDFSFS